MENKMNPVINPSLLTHDLVCDFEQNFTCKGLFYSLKIKLTDFYTSKTFYIAFYKNVHFYLKDMNYATNDYLIRSNLQVGNK